MRLIRAYLLFKKVCTEKALNDFYMALFSLHMFLISNSVFTLHFFLVLYSYYKTQRKIIVCREDILYGCHPSVAKDKYGKENLASVPNSYKSLLAGDPRKT